MTNKELLEVITKLSTQKLPLNFDKILKKAASSNLPKHYVNDLVHDKQCLGKYGKSNSIVVWMPRETGTWTIIITPSDVKHSYDDIQDNLRFAKTLFTSSKFAVVITNNRKTTPKIDLKGLQRLIEHNMEIGSTIRFCT